MITLTAHVPSALGGSAGRPEVRTYHLSNLLPSQYCALRAMGVKFRSRTAIPTEAEREEIWRKKEESVFIRDVITNEDQRDPNSIARPGRKNV